MISGATRRSVSSWSRVANAFLALGVAAGLILAGPSTAGALAPSIQSGEAQPSNGSFQVGIVLDPGGSNVAAIEFTVGSGSAQPTDCAIPESTSGLAGSCKVNGDTTKFAVFAMSGLGTAPVQVGLLTTGASNGLGPVTLVKAADVNGQSIAIDGSGTSQQTTPSNTASAGTGSAGTATVAAVQSDPSGASGVGSGVALVEDTSTDQTQSTQETEQVTQDDSSVSPQSDQPATAATTDLADTASSVVAEVAEQAEPAAIDAGSSERAGATQDTVDPEAALASPDNQTSSVQPAQGSSGLDQASSAFVANPSIVAAPLAVPRPAIAFVGPGPNEVGASAGATELSDRLKAELGVGSDQTPSAGGLGDPTRSAASAGEAASSLDADDMELDSSVDAATSSQPAVALGDTGPELAQAASAQAASALIEIGADRPPPPRMPVGTVATGTGDRSGSALATFTLATLFAIGSGAVVARRRDPESIRSRAGASRGATRVTSRSTQAAALPRGVREVRQRRLAQEAESVFDWSTFTTDEL